MGNPQLIKYSKIMSSSIAIFLVGEGWPKSKCLWKICNSLISLPYNHGISINSLFEDFCCLYFWMLLKIGLQQCQLLGTNWKFILLIPFYHIIILWFISVLAKWKREDMVIWGFKLDGLCLVEVWYLNFNKNLMFLKILENLFYNGFK